MSADPLDKQLLEAVLSRPRRAKADLEEAKLAGLRPARAKPGVAVADEDDTEDEDVLAKAIELGEQMVEAPWKALISLHEWTLHDTERKTRTTKPQHRLPFGEEAHDLVRRAMSDKGARNLLQPSPDFHLVKA